MVVCMWRLLGARKCVPGDSSDRLPVCDHDLALQMEAWLRKEAEAETALQRVQADASAARVEATRAAALTNALRTRVADAEARAAAAATSEAVAAATAERERSKAVAAVQEEAEAEVRSARQAFDVLAVQAREWRQTLMQERELSSQAQMHISAQLDQARSVERRAASLAETLLELTGLLSTECTRFELKSRSLEKTSFVGSQDMYPRGAACWTAAGAAPLPQSAERSGDGS
eukprot:1583508-Pleurochrysis_carterae.AAC.2